MLGPTSTCAINRPTVNKGHSFIHSFKVNFRITDNGYFQFKHSLVVLNHIF